MSLVTVFMKVPYKLYFLSLIYLMHWLLLMCMINKYKVLAKGSSPVASPRAFPLPVTQVKHSAQAGEDGCLIACPIFCCQSRKSMLIY